MPNKFNDEILREFDEIITKYQIDESYFDLVDGYIPLEKFLLTVLTKVREDERKEILYTVEDHYFDSLQEDKETIILHLKEILKD
jgi:hypothetical protein